MTGGQYKGSMKQNNQYRTPRERISDDYREMLMGNFIQPQGNPASGVQNTAGTTWPDGMPLAMVYAPESTFTDIYDADEGLDKGTIFADLFFPFEATCGGMAR